MSSSNEGGLILWGRPIPVRLATACEAGLIEHNFIQSEIDHCLFIKVNLICIVYVAETIIAGPILDSINKEIQGLGVSTDKQTHTFQLRD